jgi:hypothetical protein
MYAAPGVFAPDVVDDNAAGVGEQHRDDEVSHAPW